MERQLIERAGLISKDNVANKLGGPFGALIANTKTGQIVAECGNSVTTTNDPTAHAEVNAIRKACKKLNTFDLSGNTIYTSCEPCPMCLGAIYWAHLDKVYYSNTKTDAKNIGFDDSFIYDEIERPINERIIPFHNINTDSAKEAFLMWNSSNEKIEY
jgi:guanine deaminase